jgi:hypothetical protein
MASTLKKYAGSVQTYALPAEKSAVNMQLWTIAGSAQKPVVPVLKNAGRWQELGLKN